MSCPATPTVGFSLVRGGFLYRLYRATGLWGEGYSRLVRRAVVSMAITWLPLLVLSLWQRHVGGWRGAFLLDAEVHVRCLLTLPILLLCERFIDVRLSSGVASFSESRQVSSEKALAAAITDMARLRDAVWFQIVLLLVAYGLSWIDLYSFVTKSETWKMHGSLAGLTDLSPAGWWYLLVSRPLVAWLLLLWTFRLFLWIRFLYRIAREVLVLVPTHPDKMGGLGYVSGTHASFAMLGFALSALVAAFVADYTYRFGLSVMSLRQLIIAFIVGSTLLFVSPLLLFVPKLAFTRRQSLKAYSATASIYSRHYAERWLDRVGFDEPLPLESLDASTHADLGTSFERLEGLHILPLSRRTIAAIVLAEALPFIPVFLKEVPLVEILKLLARALA